MLAHIMMNISRCFGGFALLALFASEARARPIDRWTVEVGGTTGLMYTSHSITLPDEPDDITARTVTLSADSVLYLARNFGLGLVLLYQDLDSDWGPLDGLDLSATMLGPQAKYLVELGDRSDLFLRIAGGIQRGEMVTKTDGVEDEPDRTRGKFWLAGAGAKFFLTEDVSVDFGLSYQSARHRGEQHLDASGFIAGIGLAVYFH